jgi:RNA polymerase sigma-70 factor (ECF subfamily)
MPRDDRPASRTRIPWRAGDGAARTTVLASSRRTGGGPSGAAAAGGTAARDGTASRLLSQVAAGDEAAFADLFRLLSPRVLGLVRRVVRDQAQAEEIVQEVFVEVWRTATRFEPGRGSAETWVTMLAHRRAVDRVRAEQARSERQTRVARQEPVTDSAPEILVLDEIGTELDTRRVRAALAGLTRLQREAIELAFYGGYTYPQVASVLDVPLGTIKTRIRDGLIRLRDQLEVRA